MRHRHRCHHHLASYYVWHSSLSLLRAVRRVGSSTRVLLTTASYAFIPQLIVIIILYAVSGKNFDLAMPSVGDARTVTGNRISFFSLCLSAAITYSGAAADYFVYYPPTTPRLPLFLYSLLGLSLSFTFALLLGIGLASAIPSNPSYAAAYDISQGALITVAFDPLGAFGRFCNVIVALGLIANLIPPTYSSGVDFQILARVAQKVPRWLWNLLGKSRFLEASSPVLHTARGCDIHGLRPCRTQLAE